MFGFDDIVGQADAKERLLRQWRDNHVPHAQLLCGPQGVGKLPLALAFARYICCPNRTETDACGHCPSCVQWDKLVHPDVFFMYPYIKKKTSDTGDTYLPLWREALIRNSYLTLPEWLDTLGADNKQGLIPEKESDEILKKLSLKPLESEFRVVIVWLPEKMNETCANKMLKLLEEPPEKTIFLLVSENPELLLPTIISRTQRFELKRIEAGDMVQVLQQRLGIGAAESENIAHMANGSFSKALESIHLDEQSELQFDLFVKLMRLCYQRKIRELKEWSEDVAKLGREKQKDLLQYCQRMIRENFILNFHQRSMVYLTTKEQQFSENFAPFINERNVYRIMNEMAAAQQHIEQNVNAKIVFFDFAIKMIVLIAPKK